MVYNEPKRPNKTLDFINKTEKVKMKLKSEINAHKKGQGKDGTVNQLEKFYNEMEQMVEFKNHIPSYPRAIVDTWDINSELGKQLLELYEAYKKLG